MKRARIVIKWMIIFSVLTLFSLSYLSLSAMGITINNGFLHAKGASEQGRSHNRVPSFVLPIPAIS